MEDNAMKLTPESATDRQELIAGWKQDVLRRARALVVGAGAIGNELLKNLALLGFGYVMICDMDHVSTSNLSRTVLFSPEDLNRKKAMVAAERFAAMNVDRSARADYCVCNINDDLGAGVFNHVDVVIGCLDNIQTRCEVSRRCALVGKPYFDAGIHGLTANLRVVRPGPEEPCWVCSIPRQALGASQQLIRNSCDVFKKKAHASGRAATVQVSSAFIAALQAQEVVKYLHSREGTMDVQMGCSYAFDGRTNTFCSGTLRRRPGCDGHVALSRILRTPIRQDWTLRRTLAYAREQLGEGYILTFEYENTYKVFSFITGGRCRHCGRELPLWRNQKTIAESDLYCPDCPQVPRQLSRAEDNMHFAFALGREDEPFMELTLEQLGVPPFEVLVMRQADTDAPLVGLEMTGDMAGIMPGLVNMEAG